MHNFNLPSFPHNGIKMNSSSASMHMLTASCAGILFQVWFSKQGWGNTFHTDRMRWWRNVRIHIFSDGYSVALCHNQACVFHLLSHVKQVLPTAYTLDVSGVAIHDPASFDCMAPTYVLYACTCTDLIIQLASYFLLPSCFQKPKPSPVGWSMDTDRMATGLSHCSHGKKEQPLILRGTLSVLHSVEEMCCPYRQYIGAIPVFLIDKITNISSLTGEDLESSTKKVNGDLHAGWNSN